MGLIIDGILVAVFLFCVIYYSKKGFAASIVGFTRFWIALGVAMLFSETLADKLQPIIEAKLGLSENASFLSEIVYRVVSSGYLTRVLAFALLFIVSMIAVKILELLLIMMVKIPVIGRFNRFLGLALGSVIGIFWIQLLTIMLMALAEFLAGSVEWLSPEAFQNTVIANFLYENNLFRLIFEALSK